LNRFGLNLLLSNFSQTEEKSDAGNDMTITARTCTYELSVPDWRITPLELKDRLVNVVNMSEIVGFQTI
jgi:hypothetical protein